jgi:serine/threonine-protein kinase
MARAIESAISIASTSEVGEWVEALAHQSLLERARKTASIESGASTPLDDRTHGRGVEVMEGARQVHGVSADVEPAPQVVPPGLRRSWSALAFVAAAIAVVAPALVILTHRGLAQESPPTARVETQVRPAVRDGLAPVAAASPSSAPISPSGSATPSAGPPALAPARAIPLPGPVPLQAPRARPTRAAPPKPSCDPPWIVDGEGVKKYKLQCL